ncbi:phosphomevalonate kinase [Alkalibacterium kapii]|uniref:phosphomevalonate kinase n=1 Tax=Alkalibacterium kapii TaxID=426704 RepID=A0A511AT65_9LACT|nr:phosphomevalonate kinase [Alkalibacterium kapii]GEK90503.1 phosphomevalonate kinase [Alkalibacterium kapii]
MKKAENKAPGKLYIAGEYAVVESGYPAVIVSVDRFITVSVSPSNEHFGKVLSASLSQTPLKWRRNNDRMNLETFNEKADILLKTLEITERFLKEQKITLPYYDVHIKSDLDSADGLKYGLGSSGAVTVATILAVLHSVEFELNDDKLFKLAAVVHTSLRKKGSLGDLAAAVYTGWLAYASPDRKWISDQLNESTLSLLIEKPWPKLNIERLNPPVSMELLVGWTGQPASTESFVTSFQKDQKTISYQTFLNESKAIVLELITGLKTNDRDKIKRAVDINRGLLLTMSQTNHFVLETPQLSLLNDIAGKHGAASKTSGAGGGDCGIAFVESYSQKESIIKEWQANFIEPLPLTVYDKHN